LKKDNSTFIEKRELRRRVLAKSPARLILETHGGYGKLFDACYRGVPGVVFEKKKEAATVLALQRPEWAVYCGDSKQMIGAGLGKLWPFDFIDVDPYGDALEVIEALVVGGLTEPRIRFVANDGMRKCVRLGQAWKIKTLQEVVADWGIADLNKRYLELAQEKCRRVLDRGGFDLVGWFGYHCGTFMTHYTFEAVRRVS
jgi:hypothetical protein